MLAAAGKPDFAINAGQCDRFHDRARVAFLGEGARAGISVGLARPVALPLTLTLMERHPLGSQAFVPMTAAPFLVIVAPDAGGVPGRPRAFVTGPSEGVNYLPGTWHGVLTPLGQSGPFLIVDRIGAGDNLDEHRFADPWIIEPA